jgi:hypothetical protein
LSIKSIIKDFPEEIMMTKVSTATDHLFMVRDKSTAKPLLEEQVMAFYHATAQLLFLRARAQRDIQPATEILNMHVRYPEGAGLSMS